MSNLLKQIKNMMQKYKEFQTMAYICTSYRTFLQFEKQQVLFVHFVQLCLSNNR